MIRYLIYFCPALFVVFNTLVSYASPEAQNSLKSQEIRQFISNNFELSGQNWGIHQNPKNGKIYFANTDGLFEFNGINFTQYKLPENNSVRSVLVDQNGKIFTGSFEDFGYWEKNENCELIYRSLAENVEIEKNDEIWRIYELNNLIYFQSFTSIFIYNHESVKMIKAPFTMLFIFPVDNRFIAQIIDRGLYWFENEEFHFIEGSELFNQKKVHSIIPYTKDKILIATANNGLFLYNGRYFEFFDSEASEFLKYNMCNSALKVNDSIFIYGSILNGLIVTDHMGNILNNFNRSNGLNNNTVLSLFVDLDEGLWIGLDEGTNYIDIFSPSTHFVSTRGTLGTIYALLKDNQHLYLGTNHGLFIADIRVNGGNYHFTNLRLVEGSQGHVWSLYKFNDQILCGHNEGTLRIKDYTTEKISDITGGWTLRPYNGYLLQGSYTGLVFFSKNAYGFWNFRNKVNGFIEPVRFIESDYLGYVWASHHKKGLYKLELNEQRDSVVKIEYFDNIEGVQSNLNVFDINNRIVFANGKNILTYDYVEKKIVPLSSLNQNLGEFRESRNIVHYNKTLYWFIRDDKIALFKISLDFNAEKIFEIIQKSKPLPEADIQLLMLDDQNLLIPTREGFDIYNLANHKRTPAKSRLSIEKLVFSGKGRIKIKCSGKNSVEVPWFANNLTVYFKDPSKFSQQTKFFHYRIPEIDTIWNTTPSDNFTYLNLKHGNYTIEMTSDLTLNNVYSFPFRIDTPWYFTRLAIIAYVLSGFIIIFLIFKLFRYELNRQKELFEMEKSKENLESELDHKSYELMLTIRYLIHKNEILSDLKKEIGNIKEQCAKYPIKNLRNMEKIITQGLDTQTDDWKNAMNNLKLSQQGFFKKLLEHYPNLTPNDLRLCSYLRMNFSTKEIARLLNNSPRAVEISRYRLRKKMNLSHEINLTEVLMSETFADNDKTQT